MRKDIARIAGVSTGNVAKVKKILNSVIPEVRERLLRGEVSIHGPGCGVRCPRRDSAMPCGTIYMEGASRRRSTGCSERTPRMVLPFNPSTT